MKYEIEYKIELVISDKGNQVIKITLKSNNGRLIKYGKDAEKYVKYNQYIFGEEEIKRVKELKLMTDKIYQDNNPEKKVDKKTCN